MSVAADGVPGRVAERANGTERAVLELEAVAARSWPAREQVHDDGWLLRASSGWTKRANSALPLTSPGTHHVVIDRIVRWYADRGLRPTIVVLPSMRAWTAQLEAGGWTPVGGPVEVMVADAATVGSALRGRADLPALEFASRPAPAWVDIYRGGALPDHALDVLCGGDARFGSLRHDGVVVGVVRVVIESPWVGISAMEVVPSHRRRGVGLHLLRGALDAAATSGAEHAWLQVERDNTPAVGLYRRAGFTTHHTYRYYELLDDGDQT